MSNSREINTTRNLFNNTPIIRSRRTRHGISLVPKEQHKTLRKVLSDFNKKLNQRILKAYKQKQIPETKNKNMKNENVIKSTKNAINRTYNNIKKYLEEKGNPSTINALKNMTYENLSNVLNHSGCSITNNSRNYIKIYKNVPINVKKEINMTKYNALNLAKKYKVSLSPERPKKKSKTNENNNGIKFYKDDVAFGSTHPNKLKTKFFIMNEVLNDKNMKIKNVYDYDYLKRILNEPGIKNVSPIKQVPFTAKSIIPYDSKKQKKYNKFFENVKDLKLRYKKYFENSMYISFRDDNKINNNVFDAFFYYIKGYDELVELIGVDYKNMNPFKPFHEISKENAKKLIKLVNLFRRLKRNNVNKNSPILDMIHVASKSILYKDYENMNYNTGRKLFYPKINKNDIKKYNLNKIFNYKI